MPDLHPHQGCKTSLPHIIKASTPQVPTPSYPHLKASYIASHRDHCDCPQVLGLYLTISRSNPIARLSPSKLRMSSSSSCYRYSAVLQSFLGVYLTISQVFSVQLGSREQEVRRKTYAHLSLHPYSYVNHSRCMP